jgi:hypothetical protein
MTTPATMTLTGFAPAQAAAISRPPEHKNIYTNAIRAGVLPWDIRLMFGEVIQAPDQSQYIEEKVTVIMSPAQAKSALRILESTIKNYEAMFGEIKELGPIIENALAEAAEKAKAQGG